MKQWEYSSEIKAESIEMIKAERIRQIISNIANERPFIRC